MCACVLRAEVDKSLSAFCGNMRQARRNPGRGMAINKEERIKALDDLGFDWNPQETDKEQASNGFQDLR